MTSQGQLYTTEIYLMTEEKLGTAGVARLYAEDPNSAYWQKRARQAQNTLMILFRSDQKEIFATAWDIGKRTWREDAEQLAIAAEMLQAGAGMVEILEELGLMEGGA